jgi:ABC-2 type transport system ATP-binding protein
VLKALSSLRAPATPSAVAFSAVTKRFGAVAALEAVDLEVPIGQTVALLGPNGAGKSTAIALMLGLAQPTDGVVRTLGLDPSDAVATGRLGALLQDGGLPAFSRVADLLAFSSRIYPSPLPRTTIIERAGLGELLHRRVETLSGGEAQRLKFALAIAGDPDLIFLDEPTVGMDVETRRAFWAQMRRTAADGRTVLFATHYLEEADQVADRIVLLHRGRIVGDGSPLSIKSAIAARTVEFTLASPDRRVLASLPRVESVEIRGVTVTLKTSDADATVRELHARGLPFHDLDVRGADLEDAFVALTHTNA